MELKDDIIPDGTTGCDGTAWRKAQSPSKDDYEPPGNRGFFNACVKPTPGVLM
jgi:hypothetical protein